MNKKLKVSPGTGNDSGNRVPRTRLTDAEYIRCLSLALKYIKEHGSIRNLQLRGVASISYDQAIHFFSRAVQEGRLSRQGSSSATH